MLHIFVYCTNERKTCSYWKKTREYVLSQDRYTIDAYLKTRYGVIHVCWTTTQTRDVHLSFLFQKSPSLQILSRIPLMYSMLHMVIFQRTRTNKVSWFATVALHTSVQSSIDKNNTPILQGRRHDPRNFFNLLQIRIFAHNDTESPQQHWIPINTYKHLIFENKNSCHASFTCFTFCYSLASHMNCLLEAYTS